MDTSTLARSRGRHQKPGCGPVRPRPVPIASIGWAGVDGGADPGRPAALTY